VFGSRFGSVLRLTFGSAPAVSAAAAVLRASSAAAVAQRCPWTAASPPVGQFVNPVVINPAFINPVVVNQVVVGKSRRMPAARPRPGANSGDHKNAKLCFACGSRAKVICSPWQTGWRSARALADHPLMVIH